MTRLTDTTSTGRSLEIELDDEDQLALDERFSGRLLRVPRAKRRPSDDAGGEVVIVMGMPGAGKTAVARELETDGYERLNRDALGGSLADLTPRLDELLVAGHRRVVLDNTYPTRKSRNEVIETAWQRGVPVRCIWLTTNVGNAQINSIRRMLDVHGSLPTPDEIRQRSKKDPRYLVPDAQFRYERTVEPPAIDEGFVSVDTRTFVEALNPVFCTARRTCSLLKTWRREPPLHSTMRRHMTSPSASGGSPRPRAARRQHSSPR